MANQKQSGLDIDLGNLCSKDAFDWAKTTFRNRENKAGAIALKVDGVFSNMLLFGNQRIGIGSDGIGTKIELTERTGIYNTLGYDLVAMVADDLATAGFEPTSISNIIDVDKLDREIINELMKGLAEACNFANMSITGGEIAELGNRINGWGDRMHFNWCSTAIGILPDNMEKPIDGSGVKPGQVVIALRSRGFRSNGYSLLRRTMQAAFGDNWHAERYNDEKTWGEALLTPSLIYCPLISKIIANNIIPQGAAHITGGGIADNFRRVLKTTNYGAVLNNLHEPLEVMQRVIEVGNIAPEDAYLYWNMGNGMLLVVEESEADKVLELADSGGYQARKAGTITQSPEIRIECGAVQLKYDY
jgi:phosphoribosylformylglycinamidine cyclo-ligase